MQEELIKTFITAGMVPVIGAIVALVFGRIGITGKVKQLDLIEKKISVFEKLCANSQIDSDVIDKFREDVEAAIRATISAPESGENDALSQEIEEYYNDPGHAAHSTPAPLKQLGWWRRWIFLPFAQTFFGWLSIAFYYYALLAAVSAVTFGISFVVDPIPGEEPVGALEGFIMVAFGLAFYFGARAIVLALYNRYVADSKYRHFLSSSRARGAVPAQ